MGNKAKWIDTIISDLVNPEKKITDILLKVQVLADQLKNEKLKEWVISELNGYESVDSIPKYRVIPALVYGNLVQHIGRPVAEKKRALLPIENMDSEIYKTLNVMEFKNSISEIDKFSESNSDILNRPLSKSICTLIQKHIVHYWYIVDAWQEISRHSLQKIITSLRSNLIDYLQQLDENVDLDNLLSNKYEKEKIDKIFDKTIGTIKGKTVNITVGSDNQQNITVGEYSTINSIQGDKSTQNISIEYKENLKKLIDIINENLNNLGLALDEEEDIKNQVKVLQSQQKREKPKISIINTALYVIQNILTGVAANVYTPIILEQIQNMLA